MIRVAFALLLPSVLAAGSAKVWEISDYEDFLPGRFENLSLDRQGELTLGPSQTAAAELDDAVAWAAARARDGSVYLGTGHEGKLYRLSPDGDIAELWRAPEIEIFAVALAADGAVYAASSPNGKIYRVRPDGGASEYFDPEEEYVWSLLVVEEQGREVLYAGTGPEGKVYRVAGPGQGEVYYDTSQRHVLALARDAEGRLLAGTDPEGVLYRIDGQDRAFTLYDSDLPEIRAVRSAPDGSLIAAAMGGATSLSEQVVQAVSSAVISVTATASASSGPTPPGVTAPVTVGQQPSGLQQLASSAPVVSYGVETSAIYRIRPDSGAERLWTSTEENILGMDLDPAAPDRILFATDNAGRVYALKDGEQADLVAQTDRGRVTSLTASPDGLTLSAAAPAGLWRLDPDGADRGVYETGVHDAGTFARWGRLDWKGEGRVAFETRSGNSARPDAAWSPWSEPIESPDGAPIASPPARYLQWRATLHRDGGASARLESVRVAYLPRNRPPLVSSVQPELDAGSGDGGSDSKSNQSSSTSDSTAAYTVTVSAGGGGSASSSRATSTEERAINSARGRKIKLTWSAEDPDGDELIAVAQFRGEDETEWKTLKRDVAGGELSIDSDALADGRYRFRVTVSDRRSNPPDVAREADKISGPVLIDHTPPAVRVIETTPGVHVRFEARDQASPIARAEYSIDAGPWTPLRAEDGVTDSLVETFRAPIDDLDEGERLVVLRVRDRVGNAGLAKQVIR